MQPLGRHPIRKTVMSSEPLAAPPAPERVPLRLRGVWGACLYGLWLLAIVLGIGAAGALLLWFQTDSPRAALWLLIRLGLLGGAAGLSATLCTIVCGARREKMLTLRCSPGDIGGQLGFLLAVLALGYAGERGLGAGRRGDPLAVGTRLQIAGPTLDGGQFDLAELRGKVVLVDFWATWCGPCVAEFPNVKAVYDKYHAAGLEMVGVSLDEDRAALLQFVKQRGVPWPQLFFDPTSGQGWANPVARRYRIDGIPRMIVVGRDGKVLHSSVRGPEVEQAVGAALGKTQSWGQRGRAVALRLLNWTAYTLFSTAPWQLLALVVGAVAGGLAETTVRRFLTRA
jgi:thiol-disulfide isomerase/thioredoxin